MTQNDVNEILTNGLAAYAKTFEGVREVGGNNKGEFVRMFQKSIDGQASGEAWCSSFVSYCIKTWGNLVKESIDIPNFKYSSALVLSESVCNFWFNNPESFRLERPEVGCLMLWRRWSEGKPTWQGHVGIVVNIVSSDVVQTIEGNTSSDNSNERDGDGVFIKNRNLTRNYGSLRPLGFLRTF